jgi:hypothetical protein
MRPPVPIDGDDETSFEAAAVGLPRWAMLKVVRNLLAALRAGHDVRGGSDRR